MSAPNARSSVSVLKVRLDRPGFSLDVDLQWDRRVAVLFGPSGSGKTTVLECVLGLHPNALGRIELAGRCLQDSERKLCIAPEQRALGWVPQDPMLFPHLNVRDNVRFGLRRAEGDGEAALARAVDVLEIKDLLGRSVDELSGGERQRVALARAIASGPRALLLDEPLAALDLPLRARVLPYLLRVRDELSLPMLYITHDPDEAMMIGEVAAVLDRGRLVATGAPREVLWSRAVRPLSEALGLENVLDAVAEADPPGVGEIRLRTARGLPLTVPWSVDPGAGVTVGIRAEDVLVALDAPGRISARNVIAATVTECDSREDGVLVHTECGTESPGERLTARLTHAAAESLAIRSGTRIHLVIKAHSIRRLR